MKSKKYSDGEERLRFILTLIEESNLSVCATCNLFFKPEDLTEIMGEKVCPECMKDYNQEKEEYEEMKDLLTVKEAAEILNLSLDGVYNRVYTKKIGLVKKGGRIYIPKEEISKYQNPPAKNFTIKSCDSPEEIVADTNSKVDKPATLNRELLNKAILFAFGIIVGILIASF